MKKGKKIVIGVAAVAVVAGVFMRHQVQAAGDHRFRRLLLPKRRQEMWRRS